MTLLTCREVAALLGDYVERDLPSAQRAAFEAHLAGCDRCVTYMRRYEQAVRLGKRAFDCEDASIEASLPPSLLCAVLTALRRS